MLRSTVFAIMLLIGSGAPSARACDTDAECGPGGTCIKREKRASGVCYGRLAPTPAPEASAIPGTPRPLTGVRRQRATEFFGDPEQNIRERLPGKEVGAACMLNQDCPPGSECVIAGFEGRCVNL